MYIFFPIFVKFRTLENYKKFTGGQKIMKFWEMVDWIFISISTKFQLKIPSFAPRKPLMSTQKKYVYSCQMGFGSECSLGGTYLPCTQCAAPCEPCLLRAYWRTPYHPCKPSLVLRGVRPCLAWAGALPVGCRPAWQQHQHRPGGAWAFAQCSSRAMSGGHHAHDAGGRPVPSPGNRSVPGI